MQRVRDSRRTSRRDARVDVRIRRPGVAQDVTTSDISRFGCRLTGGDRLHEGAYLLVTFPGFEALDALVTWCDGARMGVEFRAPLHRAVADHLAARSVPGEE